MRILLFVLVVGAAAVAWRLLRRRRTKRDTSRLLEQVATILGGHLRRSHRDAPRGAVHFEQAGQHFTLYREERVEGHAAVPCCVVELDRGIYSGAHVDMWNRRDASRSLPPAPTEAVPIDDDQLDARWAVFAEKKAVARVRKVLANDETQRLLGFALDRKSARLHLSPKGVWFECIGFPNNAELIASMARTGAGALARVIDRLRPPRRTRATK